jgi:DNA recombination protein RmuC
MPLGIELLIALLIGGALGFLCGWLKWSGKNARLEELRQQIVQREADVDKLRGQFFEASNARAAAEAKQTEQLTFFNQQLVAERKQLETIEEKFRKEFEAISNKLFLDNTTRFNQQSADSLDKLLSPLRETLGEFKTSLETTRQETATHSALLKEQISRIGSEAANLSKALKGNVKVLGNWGENMLDQILEKSGLQRDVHYRRQRGAKDGEGDQRFLDVIVELPEKRNLVIDSKVSLRAYEESVNAPDDIARLAALDRHVDALRKHFRDLGAKRYHDIHGINAPDFVLMYVPIEAAFFVAIGRVPNLFAEALDNNVVLTTNSTLLATLRTVSHVWRLADQQKNALEIADRGGKLYDKFVGFIESLQEIGKALDSAQSAWGKASTQLHAGPGNLVRQAEQLKILGVKATKTMPPSIVEKATEELAAIPPPSTLRLPGNPGK